MCCGRNATGIARGARLSVLRAPVQQVYKHRMRQLHLTTVQAVEQGLVMWHLENGVMKKKKWCKNEIFGAITIFPDSYLSVLLHVSSLPDGIAVLYPTVLYT